MNLIGTIGGAKETLKQMCAALSREYKVPIELDDNSEGAHTHGKNSKVVIGTKNLSVYGLDYHIGLVLHEIAHIRFSPEPPKISKGEMLMLNMVEDERIDQLQKEGYEGAEYYLDELHNPTYEAIEAELEKPILWAHETHTINDLLYKGIVESYLDQAGKSITTEAVKIEIERRKAILLQRIIGFAYLLKENRAGARTSTGHPEADHIAKEVKKLLQRATGAKKDEIPALAKQAHELLKDLLPEHKSEDETPTHYATLVSGGGSVGTEAGTRQTDNIFRQQDSESKPAVDKLKRKLLAKMRENEHQKYTNNKRKGLLNKRSLRKVALKNYRLYKKREETKGQKYSIEIAIDVSGSMWNGRAIAGRQRIDTAQYCASLLVRTFRALGFETGLSVFGNYPKTILHPKDRYIVENIQAKIGQLDGYVYGGGTDLKYAIEHSVKLLQQARADTKKVFVIITDGAVNERNTCREMLKKAEKKGISTMIFYLDVPAEYASIPSYRVLDDEKRERYVKNGDLIPACVELAKELTI